jgi:ubiquitin-activating enzyme E1-like protein 2
MINVVKNYKIKEFVPDEKKAKMIENEVENKNNNDNNINEKENENNKEILNNIKSNFSSISNLKLNSIEFNKDDNYQIDLITSMSNLRCINYSIQTLDWLSTKIKVGKIIPALSTTTSCVAALQTIELIKILFNFDNIEMYKNSFLNLSLPLIQFSEPGEIKKNLIKNGLFSTIWDIWKINININDNNENNIKFLFEKLREKYQIEPKDIFKEKKIIYSYKMNNNILNMKLNDLLGFNLNNNNNNYIDVTITFTLNSNSEEYLKNIPIIRIVFNY